MIRSSPKASSRPLQASYNGSGSPARRSPSRKASGGSPPRQGFPLREVQNRVRPLPKKPAPAPVSSSDNNFQYLKRTASGSKLTETNDAADSDFVMASPTKRETKTWRAGSPERIQLLNQIREVTKSAPPIAERADLLSTDRDAKVEAEPARVETKSRDKAAVTTTDTFTPSIPFSMDQHPVNVMRRRNAAAAGEFKHPVLRKTDSFRSMPDAPQDDSTSIVSMLAAASFAIEGQHPEFKVFRVGGLHQSVSVSYSTVPGKGRAVPGKHYVETSGVVTFEKGKDMASFQIEVVDDDGWEPIRDFVVRLDKVVEGTGIIGSLNWSNCGIVDDDIYPLKV